MAIQKNQIPFVFKVLFLGTLFFISWQTLTPQPLQPLTVVNDKIGHISAFFALMFLFKQGWKSISFTIAFILLLNYGIGIEILQYFIPGRSFSIADMFADALGLLLGIGLSQYFRNYI